MYSGHHVTDFRRLPGSSMKENLHKFFGVTLAFSLVAALVVSFLFVLSNAGVAATLSSQVDSWTVQGLTIVGSAAGAGLIVDALRWIGDLLWRDGSGSGPGGTRLRCPR